MSGFCENCEDEIVDDNGRRTDDGVLLCAPCYQACLDDWNELTPEERGEYEDSDERTQP